MMTSTETQASQKSLEELSQDAANAIEALSLALRDGAPDGRSHPVLADEKRLELVTNYVRLAGLHLWTTNERMMDAVLETAGTDKDDHYDLRT